MRLRLQPWITNGAMLGCNCYCKYTTLKCVCQEVRVNILIFFLLWGCHNVTMSQCHRGVTGVTSVTSVTGVNE